MSSVFFLVAAVCLPERQIIPQLPANLEDHNCAIFYVYQCNKCGIFSRDPAFTDCECGGNAFAKEQKARDQVQGEF